MMTILQVSAYAGPTGGNHIPSLLRLEARMQAQGYETVYVLLDTVREYEWCRELMRHAKVYFLPLAKARILPETYRRLSKIFKTHDVRIVHSHFELYDIPVVLTAPKQVKIFWHLHDAMEDGYAKAALSRRILTRLQYKTLSRRATILTVSKKHGEFICRLGFDKSRLIYIPNGIDLSRIARTQEKDRRSDFLMFSWDYLRKGADLAVRAGEILAGEGHDFTIKMIPGGKDPQPPFVISAAPEKDVNLLYAGAGCFLHLSRAEGLSYALLEAVYSGLPVICSDIPENLVVKDCPTVIMVQSENVDQITDAMRKLITGDLRISSEQVDQSRKFVEDGYSFRTWENQVLDAYFAR